MRITQLIDLIDTFNEWLGKTVSWLVLAMVLVICYDVAMRYCFGQGSVALQEWQWHLFALLFLLGAAYTFKHDDHVRVDIFYRHPRCSDRQRAWINLFGIIVLLFPFCILVVITAWPFVENAFYYQERSPDPGGLSHRYLIKASIIGAFLLLLLQGIAELLKQIRTLQQGEQ